MKSTRNDLLTPLHCHSAHVWWPLRQYKAEICASLLQRGRKSNKNLLIFLLPRKAADTVLLVLPSMHAQFSCNKGPTLKDRGCKKPYLQAVLWGGQCKLTH